ncbi:GNAT family N-acetyltransferase [Cupriavidus basilensis]
MTEQDYGGAAPDCGRMACAATAGPRIPALKMRRSIELLPAAAQDASLIAGLHTQSWRHAYQGQLPADYLEREVPAERLRAWRATPGGWRRGPLEVTLARVDGEPAGFSLPATGSRAAIRRAPGQPACAAAMAWTGALGKRLFARIARGARPADGPGSRSSSMCWTATPRRASSTGAWTASKAEAVRRCVSGANLIVTVRRVSWPSVDALLRRLGA